MAAFKKGQLVTVLGTWDGKGTVFYQQAIVYSCGKKQMVLTDEATGEELGARFYNPRIGDVSEARGNGGHWQGVFPRMSDAEAELLCLEAGALMLIAYNEHFDFRIKQWGSNLQYKASMEKSRAELHEPRAVKRVPVRRAK